MKKSMEFSADTRTSNLEKLPAEIFDLLVIGGGITGAGVARDAASRGMRVALVEMQDFAQGTSSRSSKLIHGGIRYLENLEFHLVFEALSERRNLFEIAPHLVHPLRFMLPLYKGGRVGMGKMGLGMWLYDALSMFEAPELHERLTSQEALQRAPLLQPKEMLGAFEYSDAYMDDDRLVIETLRSASKLGAICVNFCEAKSAVFSDGVVRGVGCIDRLTGREFLVQARHVVGTTGPWTDRTAIDLLKTWRRVLRPSKGVHLTLDRRRLPLERAVVMATESDKRIVFGIPRHEMIIIGTTDTDFSGDPGLVGTTEEDVGYLLRVVEKYFPGARLTEDDLIASYAGVRPLVDDGASTESKTSREHLIHRDPRGITFVAGGKYTTYRLMSKHAVEVALEAFPIEDQVRFRFSETLSPLNSEITPESLRQSKMLATEVGTESQISGHVVEALVERHGPEAFALLESLSKSAVRHENSEDVEAQIWVAEAEFAVRNTMCLRLLDFYTRRSPLFLARKDHGVRHLERLSMEFALRLRWTEERRQQEMQSVRDFIANELKWKRQSVS